MPDENKTTAVTATTLTIPDEVATKFADFVELIKGSQSMDTEERQYWVDVLPIMSEDQLNNLRGILNNEKKQIEETNKAYSKGMGELTEKVTVTFDEATYLEKKKARVAVEMKEEQEEAKNEAALLEEVKKL
jgi:hypothetical protein